MIKDQTRIVGIAQTPLAKKGEGSEKRLPCQAIVAALDAAGIDPSEVDAFGSFTMKTTEEEDTAKNIGAGDVTFFSRVGYGGGGGCATVGHVAMAVATGQARVGVAWWGPQAGTAPLALSP